MASPAKKPRGKRALVEQWLAARGAAVVEESDLEALRAAAGVSSGYLRRILRESGAPLAAMVEGVRQDDFASLERTLLALLEEYQRGDRARQQAVRRLVIEARDHARWAARKPGHVAEKEEMMLWMLTWLENPPLFPQWVALRRRIAQDGRA